MWKGIVNVLFWKYERGSLAYDLMVLAILAFIFLTPPELFDGTLFEGRSESQPAAGEPTQSHPPSKAPLNAKPDEEPEEPTSQ